MRKIFAGLAAVIVLAVGGLAIFLATLDANKYRGQVAEELSKQTGREIKLNGPIKFNLSWHGATLSVEDVSFGNPSWASSPEMAKIGRFGLGVSLIPLFDRQLVITSLEIADADIDLETGYSGVHNWDIKPAGHQNVPTTSGGKSNEGSGSPVTIHVDRITIKNSRMTVHDKGDKTSILKVSSLTLSGRNAALDFDGEYNGVPVTLNVKTGMSDLFSPSGAWPINADLTYANYRFTAKGHADLDKKTADLSSYEIMVGQSGVRGGLMATWEGAKPFIRGTMFSDLIDPADFKMADKSIGAETPKGVGEPPSSPPRRLFSDAPLSLEGLKLSDAAFDVKIDEIKLSGGALKQMTAMLKLNDGLLSLVPFKAMLGSGVLEGEIKISGAELPPALSVALSASGMELEDMMHLANAPVFLTGKANANINLASSGGSAHELASNAVGVINFVTAHANISTAAVNGVAAGLMWLFSPGGSNNLNCLAARFIVKNGVARDNGILADTGPTTFAGWGYLDMGKEVINLDLRAKIKQVTVGQLAPSAHIGGTFLSPHFAIDPSETIENVTGLFKNGSINTGVPEMVTQQGQNSCIYTLDHPAPASAPGVLSPGLVGKARDQLNNIGGALQHLFGK